MLSANIARYRKRAGFSQKELATKLILISRQIILNMLYPEF